MQSLLNLPGPIKAGIAACSGASVMGVVYLAVSGNTTLLYLLGIGVCVVALMVGLYVTILKWRKKQSGNKMNKMLSQHNSGSPSAVSGAESRVKLDDLRQRFTSGIQQYKKHGKDLYSLPWYVIVGEPGSGKTEAIRRSGIGFPPNLQDEQQGLGGTINMNWWFTNHGVILDTAGRMLFEEIVPGSTSEWKEFLNLLAKGRPNCPVNGLILAIPTDSLIKDSSSEIEAKAKRIAVQLDEIQRVLDIRFPVFVLITKTDLIPGFREFFKDLADPDLEHQMIGWSNPAPLDDAFQPAQVQDYLNGLVKSIEKRRYGLLREPDHSGAHEGERWIDQVDSVYAFPRGLEQIFPRLRRYLELVFVAGEWAQKPLFLRGIYLTSSLQEGAVLDSDLASALGMGVQDLPEDISFVRKGSLFLRDVYLEKIFREKGLVTRATKAGGVVRRRQILVFGVGFCALAGALALAWFGASSLRQSIGEQRAYWDAAASDRLWNGSKWRLPIVEDSPVVDGYVNNEQSLIPVGGDEEPYIEFLANLHQLAQQEIKTPVIFKPVEWVVSGLSGRAIDRSGALRKLYEAGVLRPLIVGAQEEFQFPDTAWTAEARDAMNGLILLERQIAEREAGMTPRLDESVKMVPSLMRYLTQTPGDARLVNIFQWIYSAENGGDEVWPPIWASSGVSLASNAPLRSAIEKFVDYIGQEAENQETNLALVKNMVVELDRIDAAEKALFAAAADLRSDSGRRGLAPVIATLREALIPAAQSLEAFRLEAVDRGMIAADEPLLLSPIYAAQLQAARDNVASAVEGIEGALPAEGSAQADAIPLFADIRQRLTDARSEIEQVMSSSLTPTQVARLEVLDKEFLAPDIRQGPVFNTRLAHYQELIETLEAELVDEPIGRLTQAVIRLEGVIERLGERASGYMGPRSESFVASSDLIRTAVNAQRLEDLASEYRGAVARLGKELRFPLVLPVDRRGLSHADVERIAEQLGIIDRELDPISLEPFAQDTRNTLSNVRNEVRPVLDLARTLVGNSSTAATVTIELPGEEGQADGLRELIGNAVVPHINYVWEEIQVNDSKRTRTRRREGTELGAMPVDSPDLRLRFYKLNEEEPGPLVFSGPWASLQWLHASKGVSRRAGQTWDLLIQRTEGDNTYYMIISLSFPQAIPSPDKWIRRDTLLERLEP